MTLGRRCGDLVGPLGHLLAAHRLDLLREGLVAFEHLLHGLHDLRVIEVFGDVAHRVLGGIEHLLGLLARNGLDTAHAGRNGALRENLEEADIARGAGVRTAAQFDRRPEADHADLVAVFLAEEHHRTALLGLLLRSLAVLHERIVGADGPVDELLHLAQLLGRHLLEMREVETQDFGRHQRTLLLDMRAEHLAQRLVHEVRGGVVVGCGLPFFRVHPGRKFGRGVLRELVHDMDDQAVLLLGGHDRNALVGALDHTDVADLAARVAVERRAVENQLVRRLALRRDAAVACDADLLGQRVVAREDALADGEQLHPVVGVDGGGVARTLLLGLQLLLEGGEVHADALFAGDQLREVDRETERIVEFEGVLARNKLLAFAFGSGDHAVQQVDARGERAQERGLLLLDHFFDQSLLGLQLGELAAHLPDQSGNQAAERRLGKAEVGVAVAHGAAQDAADDIARLDVRRQLAVGDREGDGAQVVGDHAHGHVGLPVLAVFLARHLRDAADRGLENVGVVVRLLALEDHAEALEAHARVDVARGKFLQRAVCLAVELHEDEVPDLDHLRMARVDHLAARFGGDLRLVAQVEVDFRAGSAGSRLAHLPEIIVLVAADDMVRGQVPEPVVVSLLVERHAVLLRTFEHRGVHPLGGQSVDAVEQFPGPLDRLLLEVIAVGPVAQHLEHRMVVGVVADLLQVVVLARNAQTFLRIGRTRILAGGVAQEDVLELVHARVGEHQRGVALDDHRGRRHDSMPFRLEEVEKGLTNFI